jgi:hypothetical protein
MRLLPQPHDGALAMLLLDLGENALKDLALAHIPSIVERASALSKS